MQSLFKTNPANRTPSLSILRVLFFSTIHFLLFSCQSFPYNTENLNRDYYFDGSTVQIQGKAVLPEPFSESGKTYFSILERRKLCMDNALLNSHTKWLSLTLDDRQDPAEWLKRLNMGAMGPWTSCLQKAKIINNFYDDILSCRVVVLYRCRPSNY